MNYQITTANDKGMLPTAQRPDLAPIANRYGNAMQFVERFSPAKVNMLMDYIDQSAEAPNLAQLCKIYKPTVIRKWIAIHVKYVATLAGKVQFTDEDADITADLLYSDKESRLLNVVFYLGFFYELKCGKHALYSFAPSDFLRAFQGYVAKARERQYKVFTAARERQERARQAQAEASMEAEWKRKELETGKTRQELIAECFQNINKLTEKLS